jgi:sugar lactone lactonase YvrE
MAHASSRWFSEFCAIIALIGFASSVQAGGLYVADSSGNRVVRFKTKLKKGEIESLVLGQADFQGAGGGAGPAGMNEPWHVIFQPSSGILWVSDFANERVLGFKASGGKMPFTDGQDADLVLGQPDLNTDSCNLNQHGLCGPNDVAFDASGNVWVADLDGNRVVEFVPPFTTGMEASLVIGQSDFTSSGHSTTATGLFEPWSLTFDPSGNLWVLDAGNNRIVEYKPPFSTGMAASMVLGQPDLTSNGCNLTRSGMCPSVFGGDVRTDQTGNVWMLDIAKSRILEFPRGTGFTDGEDAAIVIGQADFTSDVCATTQNGLCLPGGLTFDSKGNLFVAEEGNCRVLEFKPKKKKFQTDQNASLVLAQPNFTSNKCSPGQSTIQSSNGVSFGP